MRTLVIYLIFLSAGSAAAQEQMDAAQRRCFCLQSSPPDSVVPYFLGRMDWAECKDRGTDFVKDRDPLELNLLSCDDLEACLQPTPKERELLGAALKKVDDITEALRACCRGDMQNCPKDCAPRYERELKAAKKKSARLEQKALRRQDACIAKKKPATLPAGKSTGNIVARNGQV